jgi:hypothetical protein
MPSLDDILNAGGAAPLVARRATDPTCAIVDGEDALAAMADEVLGEREHPIVGLALRADAPEPVLPADHVQALLAPGARLYLVLDDELLDGLARLLGDGLSLRRGTARIWWPGAGEGDPREHPLVCALADEPDELLLREFARALDLSRPRVRREVAFLEETHELLELELADLRRQLAEVHERLRDVQIECHGLRMRAQAAEARLAEERPR